MDWNLASVANFMQQGKKSKLPERREVVIDQASKVEHPGEVCDLKGGRCAKLLGCGTRRMSILGVPVNVYSVGVYSAVPKFQHHMSKHKGKTAKALASDEAFLADLKNPVVEKEIRIVTVFKKVTKDTFWKAIQKRVGPHLTPEQRANELAQLKAHFDSVPFRKGMDIRLALASDGTIATVVDGSKKGQVMSKPLSSALVDVYLGKQPPSPSMKTDFISSAATLLK